MLVQSPEGPWARVLEAATREMSTYMLAGSIPTHGTVHIRRNPMGMGIAGLLVTGEGGRHGRRVVRALAVKKHEPVSQAGMYPKLLDTTNTSTQRFQRVLDTQEKRSFSRGARAQLDSVGSRLRSGHVALRQ